MTYQRMDVERKPWPGGALSDAMPVLREQAALMIEYASVTRRALAGRGYDSHTDAPTPPTIH